MLGEGFVVPITKLSRFGRVAGDKAFPDFFLISLVQDRVVEAQIDPGFEGFVDEGGPIGCDEEYTFVVLERTKED